MISEWGILRDRGHGRHRFTHFALSIDTNTHTIDPEYRSSAAVRTLSAYGGRGLILSPSTLKVQLRLLTQRPTESSVLRHEGVPRHDVCGGLIAGGSVVKFLPTTRTHLHLTKSFQSNCLLLSRFLLRIISLILKQVRFLIGVHRRFMIMSGKAHDIFTFLFKKNIY